MHVLSQAHSPVSHHDCGIDPVGFDDLGHARAVLSTHDGHGGACLPFLAATAYSAGLSDDL